MFSRGFLLAFSLACALCATLAVPAAAQLVIQEGDHYSGLNFTGESLLMTGGVVDSMDIYVDHSRIEGGQVGRILSYAGEFEILGGQFTSYFFCYMESCSLLLHGYDFRLFTDNGNNGRGRRHLVEGVLLDGQFISLRIAADNVEGGASAEPDFVLYGDGSIPGDADGDQDIDLSDLNAVRNHFGESGVGRAEGDLTGDGSVGLDDLNEVRNRFGSSAPYTLGPEYAVRQSPVPEPGSLVLLSLGCLVLWQGWHRRKRAGCERAARGANPAR